MVPQKTIVNERPLFFGTKLTNVIQIKLSNHQY